MSRRHDGGAGATETGWRLATVVAVLALCFLAIASQLVRLGLQTRGDVRTSAAEPLTHHLARPDILDRQGRVIATDVDAPSLYADPALILDVDEVVEKLARTLPGLDMVDLRRSLADKSKRFHWIRRGLAPIEAQRLHDLGLPGLAFRREPKRVFPLGRLVGHLIGQVNVDNRGLSGIEKYIDETHGTDLVVGAAPSRLTPVRLSIDLGVMHALEAELSAAMVRYKAPGAAGLVLDVTTGEVLASASLPGIDPNRPSEASEPGRLERLQTSVYELGSIFKMLTVALAVDAGAPMTASYDVARPLEYGRFVIKDSHPIPSPAAISDIFTHSSNLGAARMALSVGVDRHRAFLERLGLLGAARSEAGPIAPPIMPGRWGELETVTIAYGHGLAVAPMQFGAAAATLLNGGYKVTPTYVRAKPGQAAHERLISAAASQAVRDVMRANVKAPHGTGRRADVPGLEVGGKTGTAEMAAEGGYLRRSVVSSFVAAFPMSAPKYVTFVSLFEPQPTDETKGQITAAVNAAPTTGRLIERLAPILRLIAEQDGEGVAFDGTGKAK